MKNICVESTQDEKPPRPKIKSWMKPSKNTCHKKEVFEKESPLEEKFK